MFFNAGQEMQVGEDSQQEGELSVLVVDDDEALRMLMSECFRANGIRAMEARNGKECLSLAEQFSFDLIFMDIVMPEMDGLEATLALRRRGIETTIIAISSGGVHADKTLLEAARAVGADGSMKKPFDAMKLAQDVPRLVRTRPKRA